jgi:hypothetical protein
VGPTLLSGRVFLRACSLVALIIINHFTPGDAQPSRGSASVCLDPPIEHARHDTRRCAAQRYVCGGTPPPPKRAPHFLFGKLRMMCVSPLLARSEKRCACHDVSHLEPTAGWGPCVCACCNTSRRSSSGRCDCPCRRGAGVRQFTFLVFSGFVCCCVCDACSPPSARWCCALRVVTDIPALLLLSSQVFSH